MFIACKVTENLVVDFIWHKKQFQYSLWTPIISSHSQEWNNTKEQGLLNGHFHVRLIAPIQITHFNEMLPNQIEPTSVFTFVTSLIGGEDPQDLIYSNAYCWSAKSKWWIAFHFWSMMNLWSRLTCCPWKHTFKPKRIVFVEQCTRGTRSIMVSTIEIASSTSQLGLLYQLFFLPFIMATSTLILLVLGYSQLFLHTIEAGRIINLDARAVTPMITAASTASPTNNVTSSWQSSSFLLSSVSVVRSSGKRRCWGWRR